MQVTGADGKPVSGATVLFEPQPGKAVIHFDGNTTTATTDISGFATAPTATTEGEGILKVNITALSGGITGKAVATQRNFKPVSERFGDKKSPGPVASPVTVVTSGAAVPPGIVPKQILTIEPITRDGQVNVIGKDSLISVRVTVSRLGIAGSEKPAGNAKVTFSWPYGGPSIQVPAGPVSVVSDDNGIATISPVTANVSAGEFKVSVRAELDGMVATAELREINRPGK